MLYVRITRELLYIGDSRTVAATAESQNRQSKNCTLPNNKPVLSKANPINYGGNKNKRLKIYSLAG